MVTLSLVREAPVNEGCAWEAEFERDGPDQVRLQLQIGRQTTEVQQAAVRWLARRARLDAERVSLAEHRRDHVARVTMWASIAAAALALIAVAAQFVHR